jgi:CRP-like cAMP-binding protein
MYVMVMGKVRVTSNNRELATLGAGQHFGEISLLDEQPRSATVTSTSPGSVIIIRREAFQDFCQREPNLGNHVLTRLATSLADRLRLANSAGEDPR